MASPDESWNAAAICQALGCPGCFDCREDDNDVDYDNDGDWDCKDNGHYWACPKPSTTPGHDEPRSEPGDCALHEIPLIEIGADGYEVNP